MEASSQYCLEDHEDAESRKRNIEVQTEIQDVTGDLSSKAANDRSLQSHFGIAL